MIKVGALLPSGTGVEPEAVFIEDYKDIQREIGGCFDVVRLRQDSSIGEIAMVGYVHDEGLILDLPLNYYASALFGQELRGDCVLMWALSPNGEYDGDDYDLPDNIIAWLLDGFTDKVRGAYNEAMTMTIALQKCQEDGVLTREEIDNMMDMICRLNEHGEELSEEEMVSMLELCNRMEAHAITQLKKDLDDKE
jgi:hypothetical protein